MLLLACSLAVIAVLARVDSASAGGGGCREGGSSTPVPATRVAMEHFCFDPGVVTVAAGETVEISNDDPVLHNIYGHGWFEGDVNPGESVSRAFDEAGVYTFACTLHPGMTGAVIVTGVAPVAAGSPNQDDGGFGSTDAAWAGLAVLTSGAGGWALGRRRPNRQPGNAPSTQPDDQAAGGV